MIPAVKPRPTNQAANKLKSPEGLTVRVSPRPARALGLLLIFDQRANVGNTEYNTMFR